MKNGKPKRAKPKEYKACSICERNLPRTATFFERSDERADGWREQCRECHQRQRSEERDKDSVEISKKLDNAAMAVVEQATDEDFALPADAVPHAATLLEHFMNAFGGPQVFVKHWMADYLASKPGSMMRERKLNALMRLVLKVSESGHATPPLDHMTDEELEEYAKNREAGMLKKLGLILPMDDKDGEEKRDVS